MAVYENRYQRDGVTMPIQCIRMNKKQAKEIQSYHYHDYVELLFGVSGAVNAFVGTECYRLDAGAMILIGNDEFHEVGGTGEAAEYIVVKFLPSVLFSESQTLSEYTYTRLWLQNTREGKIFFRAEELVDTPIPSLFSNLIREWDGEKFGYELSLRVDVTSIVLHVMRKWLSQDSSFFEHSMTAAQGELIRKAIDYVEENYSDITEEGCAYALGVSSAYLSRIFKKGMKTSFISYVNNIKLKNAEKLLLSDTLNVTEIAERVGFSTVAYFISCFRQKYRFTPNRYRKLLRGN